MEFRSGFQWLEPIEKFDCIDYGKSRLVVLGLRNVLFTRALDGCAVLTLVS